MAESNLDEYEDYEDDVGEYEDEGGEYEEEEEEEERLHTQEEMEYLELVEVDVVVKGAGGGEGCW
ncbi:hypothetical protein HanRHA438_Chr11g0523341 [Helianthus annuus]|uniref:Uncharacterized protein n=1 Tax=Helianthus annuus TaxID=4232 RepID=A0A251VFF7_HELAN|nr:hypothetical protein HanXRQr2_Chr11g0511161 [Helianthus annuus]KAJ0511232.1 hypothetical protein HanIR_Chr11g0549641 [Helianthus annuus]KAJ0518965.1 hypothetical protein HanHA89_Chr11g0443311 [Helianthus annuus]KAJ0690773.1 hypothetical protein HanOQP8_Chr11g0421541 [Helianthus annuus]KAJ0872406.1 hypothetical protein HanRHA438_Chr11g0523341 [Helianthus annuus]